MPLYEYHCTACSEKIEVLQKVSAPPLAVCPRCGGHLEKLLSAPALQFKGTGWYITDYPKSGPQGKGSSISTETGGSESTPKATNPSAPPPLPPTER